VGVQSSGLGLILPGQDKDLRGSDRGGKFRGLGQENFSNLIAKSARGSNEGAQVATEQKDYTPKSVAGADGTKM